MGLENGAFQETNVFKIHLTSIYITMGILWSFIFSLANWIHMSRLVFFFDDFEEDVMVGFCALYQFIVLDFEM